MEYSESVTRLVLYLMSALLGITYAKLRSCRKILELYKKYLDKNDEK